MRWIFSLPLWVGIVTALVASSIGRSAEQEGHAEAVRETARLFDATAAYFAEENVHRGASVVPGGVRDIEYGRPCATLRHASWFSAEGLLAEHDLPLSREIACDEPLCLAAESMATVLPQSREIEHLALLGLASGTALEEITSKPLHLVIALDRSGSMSGDKLAIAKAGLRAAVGRLGPADRLSLVTFGSEVTTDLRAAPGKEAGVLDLVERTHAGGGTDLEEGLRVAFDIAREDGGRARVLLLTDQQPTVGRTDRESFEELVERAADVDIGLSIVGVGSDFGVALAHRMSSIAGANVSYVRDTREAIELLGDEFDTVVREVATRVGLTIDPAEGLRVARVFGVPVDMVTRQMDGSVLIPISTVFASERRGGIVIAFDSDQRQASSSRSVASLALEYRDHEGALRSSSADVQRVPTPGAGLLRARALVDEITTIEAVLPPRAPACDTAAKVPLDELWQRLEEARDPALEGELALVDRLRDEGCTRPHHRPATYVSARTTPANDRNGSPALPILRAVLGFLAGFFLTLIGQHVAPSITIERPTARSARTLGIGIILLVLGGWLGNRGTMMLARADAFENEVEGIGDARGYNEVASVRAKAKAQVAGALGLLVLAFVTVRLRREAGPRRITDR